MDLSEDLRMTNKPSGCLGLILKLIGASPKDGDQKKEIFPYEAVNLMTKTERHFFDTLWKTASAQFHIFTKMKLIEIIRVIPKSENYMSFKGKIQQSHVDFVLCDKDTLRTVVIIELDDKSHESEKARKRDEFKNKALEAANIPLVRIEASRSYEPAMVIKKISDAINAE